MGVNLWGVIHGVRVFPTHSREAGWGPYRQHSQHGLADPGASAPHDAAKHAVVAISEDLYNAVKAMRIDVGVSVLCPGIVRTQLLDADRNWPASLGQAPLPAAAYAAVEPHVRRAVEGGLAPATVAGLVAEAVASGRFGYPRTPTSRKLRCDVGRASRPARTQDEHGRSGIPAGQTVSPSRRHRECRAPSFLCSSDVRGSALRT